MGLSKKNRYVACLDCGCRLEMNGICKICGHRDEPLLAGMVPDVVGLTQAAALCRLTDPECQLDIGIISEENSDTIAADFIISTDPPADIQLAIGALVDIVVSLGPAA